MQWPPSFLLAQIRMRGTTTNSRVNRGGKVRRPSASIGPACVDDRPPLLLTQENMCEGARAAAGMRALRLQTITRGKDNLPSFARVHSSFYSRSSTLAPSRLDVARLSSPCDLRLKQEDRGSATKRQFCHPTFPRLTFASSLASFSRRRRHNVSSSSEAERESVLQRTWRQRSC